MKKIHWFLLLLLVVILFFPISNLIGLEGKNEPIPVVPNSSKSFVKVSQILQNKCVDCHSPGMLRRPVYSELPIAKQLMEQDIEQAGNRLILSKKLYSGEEAVTPLMLARLEQVVQNGSMPPTQYLLMHWTGNLTLDEKKSILDWISEERAQLAWSRDSADT